jgi:exonuclease VII small subunit
VRATVTAGAPAGSAPVSTASAAVDLSAARPWFACGTPPASGLDVVAGPGRAAAQPDRYAQWLDEVVGTGGRASTRQAAWARGASLGLTDSQRASLHGVVPDAAAGWIGMDARGCWVLDVLASTFPTAGFLLLFDHPARALTQWLEGPAGDDPATALRIWSGAARRLLRLVHRHRARCLLVDADEARRDPAAFLDACRRVTGLTLDAAPVAGTAPAGDDPLAWALAEALIAADVQIPTAYEELRAASTPLRALDADAPPSLRWTSRLDAAAAAARWRSLSTAQRDAQLARADARGQAMQLRQVRAELEHCFGNFKAAERTAAETAQRLAQARAGLDKAREKHARQVRAAAEQSQLASAQAQQLQRTTDRLLALEGSRSHALTSFVQFDARQVRLGAERDQAPHRHLGMAVQHLRWGRRQLGRLELRLLHHQGRAGLLIFAPADAAPPVAAWSESGREGPRPFMVLMPSDAQSQQRLERLGTTDWALVIGLAARLVRELQRAEAGLRDRWLSVAQCLEAQLHHLPERFRYDAMHAGTDAAEGSHPLRIGFDQVLAGGRPWPHWRLQWWPSGGGPRGGGGQASVVLLAPEGADQSPALDAWPVDDDGRPVARLPLPVDADLGAEARRQAWARFGAHDRRTLLGLLDALPAVARVLADADLPAGMTRAALEAAARRLLQQARRAATESPVRRLARQLRDRLRGPR